MEIKERPILFNAYMVRAILDGRKTQTRRVVKPARGNQSSWLDVGKLGTASGVEVSFREDYCGAQFFHPSAGQTIQGVKIEKTSPYAWIECPFGKPGDRLWVRETFAARVNHACGQDSCDCGDVTVTYTADNEERFFNDDSSMGDFCINGRKTIPSIHMPRWASRITLEIKSVRVERLQDISGDDVMAEGFKRCTKDSVLHKYGLESWEWRDYHALPMGAFCKLWTDINGKGSWDANPWVWVIEFERVK